MGVLYDKYYTNPEIAEWLIEMTKTKLGTSGQESYLEPSAGSGNFSHLLTNVDSYDIQPEGNNIIQADFLTLNIEKHYDIAIGNPPFGKRSQLAIDFFNRCAECSSAICFIIPNTFRKWSVQSKLNKDFALIIDIDLPENSFLLNGEPYNINCIYQIWVRKGDKYDRGVDLSLSAPLPTKITDFNLWQYNATEQARKYLYEPWDIAVYRQGYKDYNNIFTRDKYKEVEDIVLNTNIQLIFIQFVAPESKDIIMNMDFDKLSKLNLSTPGFGKADFIQYYLWLKNKKDL